MSVGLAHSQVTCSTKALWLNNIGLIISLTPRLPVVIWGSCSDYKMVESDLKRKAGRKGVRLGDLESDGAFWSVMWAETIDHVSWSQQKSKPKVLANKCLSHVFVSREKGVSVEIVSFFFITCVSMHTVQVAPPLAVCLTVFTEQSVNG